MEAASTRRDHITVPDSICALSTMTMMPSLIMKPWSSFLQHTSSYQLSTIQETPERKRCHKQRLASHPQHKLEALHRNKFLIENTEFTAVAPVSWLIPHKGIQEGMTDSRETLLR